MVRIVSAKGSLIWEEAGVPGENPRVHAGDHHTLSHTTTVNCRDRTWVAAARSDCIVHCATWTPFTISTWKTLISIEDKWNKIFTRAVQKFAINCVFVILNDIFFNCLIPNYLSVLNDLNSKIEVKYRIKCLWKVCKDQGENNIIFNIKIKYWDVYIL